MASLSVLFICVGNTCRSPMAEAITRKLGGGRVTAASAGLMPFGRIVATTVRTLGALGYESRGLTSKSLDDVDLASFDVIVSLLGPAGLSYLPGTLPAELQSWSIADPYGEDDDVYMAVAHELERRVRRLLEEQGSRELSIL
jgi:protein-tyrosine-phosphatase